MNELISAAAQLAWPLALVVSWMAGELAHRWTGVPRISIYGLAGFLAGNLALEVQGPIDHSPYLLLASLAFGLMLFELGYRINLRWFRHNYWVLLLGVIESLVTFGVVYWATGWFTLPTDQRLMIAAVSMAASPAGVLRVAHELRSSGQATERVLHLTDHFCDRAEQSGLRVFSSRQPAERSGIVSLECPGADVAALVARCRAAGIIVNDRAGRCRRVHGGRRAGPPVSRSSRSRSLAGLPAVGRSLPR